MRKIKTIAEMAGELCEKIWYNRHLVLREKIENGEHWLVEDQETRMSGQDVTIKSIWEGALASARRVEKDYGLENLGPYDDFEWGMINGKLSALRWVMGDDWEMLDS